MKPNMSFMNARVSPRRGSPLVPGGRGSLVAMDASGSVDSAKI
jgi:hypothetical protein